MDGREFIKQSLKIVNDQKTWDSFLKESKILSMQRNAVKNSDAKSPKKESVKGPRFPNHYIMNLPATATDFLDAFIGLYHGYEITESELPWIHCYCFSKTGNQEADVISRVEKVLGPIVDAQVFNVRNVAPKKDMMCISFRLTDVAFKTLKHKLE